MEKADALLQGAGADMCGAAAGADAADSCGDLPKAEGQWLAAGRGGQREAEVLFAVGRKNGGDLLGKSHGTRVVAHAFVRFDRNAVGTEQIGK